MGRTNDDFRQYLDEIEVMIVNEKRLFREMKETLKDAVDLGSISDLLAERRRAFDHAFVECSRKHGFGNGDIRSKLDFEWKSCEERQSDWKKYLRFTKFIPTILTASAWLFDDTYSLKRKMWHKYLNRSLELAKKFKP